MTRPSSRTADRSRAALDRPAVLSAALDLADSGGLAAVTMRAVADRLGVTAMALYPHVGDKEGLLDGLVERLNDELPTPRPELDWRARLGELAGGVIAVARRHPATFPLMLQRPAVTPNAMRAREAVFAALLAAGVPPADVPATERLVSTIALGYAVSDVAGRFGQLGRRSASVEELPVEEFPAHHTVAAARVPLADDEYAEALDAVIALVERAAAR